MRRFATAQIPQQNGASAQDWILTDNVQCLCSKCAAPIPPQREVVHSHYHHVPSRRSPPILRIPRLKRKAPEDTAVALRTPTTKRTTTLRIPRHRRETESFSASTVRTSEAESTMTSGHHGQFGRYRSSRTASALWPLMRSQVAPRKDRMFFHPSKIIDDSDSDWADEEDEVSAEMHSLNALVYRERDSAKQCAFESTHGMRQFPPSVEFSPQGMVTGGSSGGHSIFEATKRSLSSRLDPHGQCPCHYQHFASQRSPAILSAVALQTPTTKKAPTLRVPRHRREEESCSATTARTSDPASGRIADSAPVSPMTSGHFGQFDRYRSSRTASARWLSMRSQAPRKDRMFFYPSNIVDDSDSDWADAEDDVNDGGRAQVYSVSYGAAKRSVMPHN